MKAIDQFHPNDCFGGDLGHIHPAGYMQLFVLV